MPLGRADKDVGRMVQIVNIFMGDLADKNSPDSQAPGHGFKLPDVQRLAVAGDNQLGRQAFMKQAHGSNQHRNAFARNDPADEQHSKHRRQAVQPSHLLLLRQLCRREPA
ncbi:hypothetical protein D3C73_1165210 [compost metagenome]